jgi:ArsR family transcriptional regulator
MPFAPNPKCTLIFCPLDKKSFYRKITIMENEQALKSYTLSTDEHRLAEMMKALGHPARMQIIRYLTEHPQCITGDIVDVLPLAQATVSQHLKVLRDAGLICGTIEGTATCYCLNYGSIEWFKSQVGDLF